MRRQTILIALIILGVLAGCGGDGEEAGAPRDQTITTKVLEKPRQGVPAQVGQGMVEIEVVPGDDLAFTVAKVIASPDNTNFHFVNPQSVGHDLTIREVGGGKIATPVIEESSAWLRVSLFDDVRYVFYCSVPGHRQAGMEGTIAVDSRLNAGNLKPF